MKRLNAATIYYLMSAITTLASEIMFTTYAVYYVQRIGMNPLQLVLVGTVLELTILLCEVPTGVIADTYSRRLSVIIGIFILGIAWTIEGAIPLYAAIIAAEIVRGVGETFLSGATDAWLADEVGEANIGTIYVRSGQIGRVVGLIGTGISVALASLALNLPMLIGGGLYLLLGMLLTITMPEHGFTPAPRGERTNWSAMGHTFLEGARVVRRSQTLTLLLLVGVLLGVASEGFDRLSEAHLLANFRFPTLGNFKPVVWFGILSIGINITTFISTELLRPRLEATSRIASTTARALLVLNGLSALSIIGFGLAGNFWLAMGALVIKATLGALAWPLYQAWLVQNIDARVRATALSMISQTDALGQTIGGPALGALGNVSLRAAMVVAGLLRLPAMALYAHVLRRNQATRVVLDPATPQES